MPNNDKILHYTANRKGGVVVSMSLQHPRITRRTAIQAGTIGLLGLGMNHVVGLRDLSAKPAKAKAKAVIYIFLSGGLAQHDSFDPKPDAPEEIRGEFSAIQTRTPGLHICEHLPMLAQRSNKWALCRSLTHPCNEHSDGHLLMLTGRSKLPTGFDRNKPKPTDWPSIASIVSQVVSPRNNLPPAAVLPEVLIHRTGRIIPGQFGGLMGARFDPWFIKASPYNARSYGAYPEYGFHHERGAENPKNLIFQAPNLSLPEGLSRNRLENRLGLLAQLETQQRELENHAETESFDRYRQQAISLLADAKVRQAFDVTKADDRIQERYGKNSFGWSLLMARRLVEAGVSLVQVNLGNNETWDTHQNAFPNLKNFLLPPTDRAVSALLDDLEESGLLDQTLIVMAGEFGRTPRVFKIPKAKKPGRDHWGAVQTVFFCRWRRARWNGRRCVRPNRGLSCCPARNSRSTGGDHLSFAWFAENHRLARSYGSATFHLSRPADSGVALVLTALRGGFMTQGALVRQLRQHMESWRSAGVQFLPPGKRPLGAAPSIAEGGSLETRRRQLEVLAQEVAQCTRCPELVKSRTQTVFGVGRPGVELCFVGEAPGADEDAQGEPFVGAAGQLLNRIIAACKLRREDVYICNTLKCRPPNNRAPLPHESANCRDFLQRQISLVNPKFICALGTSAAQSLLQTTQSLGQLRGRFHDFQGIPVMVTYHPAYLLPHRNPGKKKDVWEDMKKLMAAMGRPVE
ncbi:MAG: hypothetical protein KatS3mg105_2451 [Gemmatales bacterium]|nr:MAG: hypothetical protein KatS3mg105_2451 [Gemmatales bacterium]